MALSAGEKQRRYRQRRDADPQKPAAYLQKKKIKYAKDNEQGKTKVVANMTEREIRKVRKEWRTYKRQRKNHQKLIGNIETPPSTPEAENNNHNNNQNRNAMNIAYTQKVEGLRMIKRNRQKMKGEIERLRLQLRNERKKIRTVQKTLCAA